MSQIVSLTCYTLKFWGATSKQDKLLAASAKLASARAALRLFDDAAVLKASLKYGLGKEVSIFLPLQISIFSEI